MQLHRVSGLADPGFKRTNGRGVFACALAMAWLLSCGQAGAATMIRTVTDLQNMYHNLAGSYQLANDIDASATATWNSGAGFLPIGSVATPFTGTLNGAGHAITGLVIHSPLDHVGLFGVTQGALVENVRLVKVDVLGASTSVVPNVGTLVGTNGGSIVKCSATGTSTPGNNGNNEFIGGLVGENLVTGSIKNSSSDVDVVDETAANIGTGGGLVGLNLGVISASHATGRVESIQGGDVGGLVGANEQSGRITSSYATGAVAGGFEGIAVGGLVGYNGDSSPGVRGVPMIMQSYATGAVIDSTAGPVGGLAGVNEGGKIVKSYATGNLGVDGKYLGAAAGGLVGDNHNFHGNGGFVQAGIIQECFATGQAHGGVTIDFGGLVGANSGTIEESYATVGFDGSAGNAAGGLVGDNEGVIQQTYAVGSLTATSPLLGGLVATGAGTVKMSYWDTQATGQPTSHGGTGKTTAQLTGALPAGFSATIWGFLAGHYPYLVWYGPY